MIHKYKNFEKAITSKQNDTCTAKKKNRLVNLQQLALLFGVIGIILFVGLLFDTFLQLKDGMFNSYFIGETNEFSIFKVREDLKHFLPDDQEFIEDKFKFKFPKKIPNTKSLDDEGNKRVCYYTPRKSKEELQPESIDVFLCTHLLLIGPFTVEKDGTITINRETKESNAIQRTLKLKKKNPKLKIMASITNGFSELAKNKTEVTRFAYNARMFLEHYKLDGIDIDWEFPNFPPTSQKLHEKELFVFLIEQLNTALRLVLPRYLLSIAVANSIVIIDLSYDFPRLNDNVDFVNLMGYDYHMYSDLFPFVGHNAPLSPRKFDKGILSTMNLEYSARIINKKGIDKNKLIVGIPLYGRTWRLVLPDWSDVNSASAGVGSGMGFTTYPKAMGFIRSGGMDEWDCEAKVPFAHRGREWISYENKHSAYLKTKWIASEKYGGVMTFYLNADDWYGGQFPLQTIINKTLGGDIDLKLESEINSRKCFPPSDEYINAFISRLNSSDYLHPKGLSARKLLIEDFKN